MNVEMVLAAQAEATRVEGRFVRLGGLAVEGDAMAAGRDGRICRDET